MNRDLNVAKMPVRKYRRDTSEVSCCLKYVIFGFNVMFWVSTLYWKKHCHWLCGRAACYLCTVIYIHNFLQMYIKLSITFLRYSFLQQIFWGISVIIFVDLFPTYAYNSSAVKCAC
jgi:hypothetical protein